MRAIATTRAVMNPRTTRMVRLIVTGLIIRVSSPLEAASWSATSQRRVRQLWISSSGRVSGNLANRRRDRAVGVMQKPFTREEFTKGKSTVFSTGRWSNADLSQFQKEQTTWVVKDFSPCSPMIRRTWGRFMVKRELRALLILKGIEGIPAEPFLLDVNALCYRFQPGTTLMDTPSEKINDNFFFEFEAAVQKMHQRGMVHLDIRNQRNVLVTDQGKPVILDFQSSLRLEKTPRFLHEIMKETDFSGVYKNWYKKKPETIDDDRRARLEALNRKRSFWFIRGYPLGTRTDRRS